MTDFSPEVVADGSNSFSTHLVNEIQSQGISTHPESIFPENQSIQGILVHQQNFTD